MDYYINSNIETAIDLCDEEIERRKNWLSVGDYTPRELPAIKNDIKRLKSIKKQLEKALLTTRELETY